MQSVQIRAASAVKPFTGHVERSVMRFRAPRAVHASKQQQTGASSLDLLPLTLGSMAVLQQPFAAWADEAAAPAAAAAADAVQNRVEAPAWLGYLLLASPIIFYAIFNVYRNQVNPRAKFTDFLFIVVGVAVVANLVSILTVHVRLF